MNSQIWFDSKHRIGRARFIGTFSLEDGPFLLVRFREIFKGKEPCNLLIDIPEGDYEISKNLFDWFLENAWELNLDRIAVVETRSGLADGEGRIDGKEKPLWRHE